MTAVKDNKVYKVDEISKAQYLADGYDIVDEKGSIIEKAKNKTVPYADYEKILDENKKLKAENIKLKKVDKQ